MRKAACLLMLVAGCGGMPTTTMPGPPDDDGDGAIDAGIGPAPGAPVRNSFDGFWKVESIIEPRQILLGSDAIGIEVRDGRVACVTAGTTESCPNEEWVKPSSDRPITNNGLILIQFTMAFPECTLSHLDALQGERLIEVVIVGSAIAGTNGLFFDVDVRQRYIFSRETVLSKGTLEHFPDDSTNSCGFDSFGKKRKKRCQEDF